MSPTPVTWTRAGLHRVLTRATISADDGLSLGFDRHSTRPGLLVDGRCVSARTGAELPSDVVGRCHLVHTRMSVVAATI